MKNKAPRIAKQEREMQRREPPKMLKPPWWTASLLLQRMVDELPEGRTLSESVKVGIRPGNRSVTATTCPSGPDSHLGASRQVSFAKAECTQIQSLAHLDANRWTPIITEDQLEQLAISLDLVVSSPDLAARSPDLGIRSPDLTVHSPDLSRLNVTEDHEEPVCANYAQTSADGKTYNTDDSKHYHISAKP